ncbi:unnamed protein product [Meganyctiphanes norvegica]|uniref:Uncharacterized protein n=1 Tax=Meganyctiphanes norvegica TaxID=48144 RepID=A0AAV2QM68_MEGNR
MKLHLKLFLCFMISLEQAAGEDPLFPEYETPGSHQEPETLITPERVHKDQVPADGGSKVSNHGIPTDDRISKTAKPKVEKKIYVDEKCCNLSTTSHCLKKGGDCVPNNETCHGKEYSGSKYCVISDLKSCKCCVPTDCEEATLEPCKLLNGTCKGDHEDCKDDESSVSGAEFCKYKTCKCCFPKDTPPCPCGQDFEGGCTGYRDKESYRGHCMKTCEPETISLPVHKCDQLGGADCKCCAKTESCDPPTCNYNGESGTCSSSDDIDGMVNVGEQDCKGCKCWVPEIEGSCDPGSCNYNGGGGFCWREGIVGFVSVGKQDCKEEACNCYVFESQVVQCDPLTCYYNGFPGICSNYHIDGMVSVGEQECRGCKCLVPKEEVQCDPLTCNFNDFPGFCSSDGIDGMISVGEQECRDCKCWMPKEEG